MKSLVATFSLSPAVAAGRPWRRLLLLGSLALTAVSAQAMDDPPGRVGRIADSQGRVWLMEAGQAEWTGAPRNRPFTTGDRLSTERGARLELEIGSTTVRLDGGSELQVVRLDDDRVELQLVSGSVALRAREHEVAREIEVLTAEGHYAPRLPGLYRIDREGRGSYGAALSGELQFDSRDSALNLRGGQRAEFWFDPSDQRTHYSWAPLPGDDFAWWVQREDARDEQQAAQRPVSAEMTGAADLDRFGRWSTHPEYGAIWTPVNVSVGWAPYRYGQWAWVAPWGWTWVDDAPWGFAPFHYGRWVFFAGHWCWAPGQYVRRPVYAPAMVAWVGGAPGVSVSVSVGPTVGWIPLAPREPYYPHYGYSTRYWQHLNSPYGQWAERPAPHEPMMYTNRGVPGGVTMVPSQALAQRQPVLVAPRRIDDAAVVRVLRSEPMRLVAPPTPVSVPGQPRAVSPVGGSAPVPVAPAQVSPRPALPVSPADARREWSSRGESPAPAVPVAPSVRVESTGQRPMPVMPQSAPQAVPAPSRQIEAEPMRRISPVPAPAQMPQAQPLPQTPPRQVAPAAQPQPQPASRQRDDDRSGDRRSMNGAGVRRVE